MRSKKGKNVKQELETVVAAVKPHKVIKPLPLTFSKPKPSSDSSSSEVNVVSGQGTCAASSAGSKNWWETLLDDMEDEDLMITSLTTNAHDFHIDDDQTWSDILYMNLKGL